MKYTGIGKPSAAAFDWPTVLSDLFLLRNTMCSSNKASPSMLVPKLVFDRQEQRFLSFAEWICFNHLVSFAQDCEDARFELFHNTTQDIVEATAEFDDRLARRYTFQADDAELQERFRRIYAPYQVEFGFTGLISAGFLRRHADLLS